MLVLAPWSPGQDARAFARLGQAYGIARPHEHILITADVALEFAERVLMRLEARAVAARHDALCSFLEVAGPVLTRPDVDGSPGAHAAWSAARAILDPAPPPSVRGLSRPAADLAHAIRLDGTVDATAWDACIDVPALLATWQEIRVGQARDDVHPHDGRRLRAMAVLAHLTSWDGEGPWRADLAEDPRMVAASRRLSGRRLLLDSLRLPPIDPDAYVDLRYDDFAPRLPPHLPIESRERARALLADRDPATGILEHLLRSTDRFAGAFHATDVRHLEIRARCSPREELLWIASEFIRDESGAQVMPVVATEAWRKHRMGLAATIVLGPTGKTFDVPVSGDIHGSEVSEGAVLVEPAHGTYDALWQWYGRLLPIATALDRAAGENAQENRWEVEFGMTACRHMARASERMTRGASINRPDQKALRRFAEFDLHRKRESEAVDLGRGQRLRRGVVRWLQVECRYQDRELTCTAAIRTIEIQDGPDAEWSSAAAGLLDR